MAAKNDITGDTIISRIQSNSYDDGYDGIDWSVKLEEPKPATDKPVEPPVLCDICGKELNKVGECAWTSCPLNWNEARADIIGQNGNIGYEEQGE